VTSLVGFLSSNVQDSSYLSSGSKYTVKLSAWRETRRETKKEKVTMSLLTMVAEGTCYYVKPWKVNNSFIGEYYMNT